MPPCTRNCWTLAALLGLLVWVMALGPGGAGVVGGAFLGFVTAWLVGGLLVMLFCIGAPEEYPEPVTDDYRALASMPDRVEEARDVPIARPARPAGMPEAPRGASADPRRAATFEPSPALRAAERRALRAAEDRVPIRTGPPPGASADPRKAATFTEGRPGHERVLAEGGETAHSRDESGGFGGGGAPA